MKENRKVIVLAYLNFLSLGVFTAVTGVAWPWIRETFAQPIDAFGWVLAAGTSGTLLASAVSGRLVSRLGLGRYLFAGNLLAAAGAMAVARAPAWELLVACFLLMGAGLGSLHAGLNYATAIRYGPRQVGLLHMMFALGATAGPTLLTGFLLRGHEWTGWYVIAAFFLSGLAILFALTARGWPDAPSSTGDGSDAEQNADLRETARQRIVWLSVALFFMYTGIESTAAQWSFSLFTESRAIAPELAGLATSLYWGTLTAGRVILGLAGHRVRPGRVVRASLIAVFFGGLLYTFAGSAPGLNLLSLAIIGMALSSLFPMLMASTPQRVGVRFASHAVGLQVSAGSLGVAALPALTGVIAGAISLEVVGPVLLVAVAVMYLVHSQT